MRQFAGIPRSEPKTRHRRLVVVSTCQAGTAACYPRPAFAPDHPDLAAGLCNLGAALQAQGD